MEQRTGIVATLSILLALGSFLLTCTGNPIWGLVAAIVSIPLGAVGLAISASPRVSGGMFSIAAIVLGAIAVVVAILGIVGAIGAWLV